MRQKSVTPTQKNLSNWIKSKELKKQKYIDIISSYNIAYIKMHNF